MVSHSIDLKSTNFSFRCLQVLNQVGQLPLPYTDCGGCALLVLHRFVAVSWVIALAIRPGNPPWKSALKTQCAMLQVRVPSPQSLRIPCSLLCSLRYFSGPLMRRGRSPRTLGLLGPCIAQLDMMYTPNHMMGNRGLTGMV